MSYTTKSVLVAEAGQQEFNISFPYLDPKHVYVKVAGQYADFSFVSDSRLRLTYPVVAGVLVEIYRSTPIDNALVQFQNGAVLTQEDLNKATRQTLYIQQELKDLYDASLGQSLTKIATGSGTLISDPTQVVDQLAQLVLNNSLLQNFQSRIEDINLNAQSIVSQAARLTSLQATVDALTNSGGAGLQTLIQSEADQRIAGDTALATTLSVIGALGPGGTSFILDINKVKLSSTESLSDRLTLINSSLGTNSASITAEASTRAAADSAMAATVALLGAKNGGGTAFILDTSKVYVDGATSLGTRLSGLDSTLATAQASIVTEQTARATADSSLASSITSLTSTVNGNTSSITSLTSVTNGLNAKYSVAVNVNGHVSGFQLNSTGATSSFIIAANVFSIVDPSSPTNQLAPFTVNSGVITFGGPITVNNRFKVAADGTVTINAGLSGARLEMDSQAVRVYDASGTLRVRLGIW
jgi:hypothetical protein